MNILVRADSSSIIGHGHIMRDLVLVKQFSKNHKIIFATQDLNGNINDIIKNNGFDISILSSNSIQVLIDVIKTFNIDFLIIDHYNINYISELEIKQHTNIKILSFDDTYISHNSDYILNHNPGAEASKYKDLVPATCKKLCGSTFTLIRDEFKQEKKRLLTRYHRLQIHTNINVLVMMGGSDPSNLTLQIIKLLLKYYKNISIHIITTKSNQNLNILNRISFQHKQITLHINKKNIADIMSRSHFAIISPSLTSAEALYMKLPFIAIQTANNQKEIISYLLKKRLPILKKFHLKKLNLQIKNLIKNYYIIIHREKSIHFSEILWEQYL